MALDPTASSIERAEACPPSHAAAATVVPAGDAADRGDALHGYVGALAVGGRAAAASKLPAEKEWKSTCLRIADDAIPRWGWRAEVAWMLDTRTGEARELPGVVGRAYPAREPWQIPGSSDLVGIRDDGMPVVWELKTGDDVAPVAGVSVEQANLQACFYGLCAARAWGYDEVAVEVVYLRHSGWLERDGRVLDVGDLAVVARRIAALVAAVERERATPRGNVALGLHCKHCPAMLGCPAMRALAASARKVDVAALGDVTESEAATLWWDGKLLEQYLEARREALRPLLTRPVSIPGTGRRLVTQETERRSLHVGKALPILAAHGLVPAGLVGALAAAPLVDPGLALGDLEDAVYARHPDDRPGRKAARAALAALEGDLVRAGALRYGTSSSLRVQRDTATDGEAAA